MSARSRARSPASVERTGLGGEPEMTSLGKPGTGDPFLRMRLIRQLNLGPELLQSRREALAALRSAEKTMSTSAVARM
jgi:hypothetical protein